MQRSLLVALSACGLIIGAAAAMYARIDRVVLSPDANAPKTIQVFGVFSLAIPANPNDYQPPSRGYLYFTLAGDESLARREWADLKATAGTGQIVAFGNRYELKPRLRPSGEPPTSPDPYATGTGLTKISSDTAYQPVRALADFRK
jgi:hypothetical protein